MSLFIAVLLVSAQAAAAPQSPAPESVASAAPAATKAKEKKICKSNDADPGSRMAKRVCRTKEDWAQQNMFGSSRSGISISGEAMQSH
jgi:hypothetical protein